MFNKILKADKPMKKELAEPVKETPENEEKQEITPIEQVKKPTEEHVEPIKNDKESENTKMSDFLYALQSISKIEKEEN